MYVPHCSSLPSPADLRRALVARLKPYTRKATPTGRVLGNGSVIELTSARKTVAGKVFRMSSMLPVAFSVGELSTMIHPNIVQCKGELRVLLME